MAERPPPFDLSFKLEGPENFAEWRSELREYMMTFGFMRGGMFRELDVEEESWLLCHIKRTMEAFPLLAIQGLDRISDVWHRLNDVYLRRCSLRDLFSLAEEQDILSEALRDYFRIGKQVYRDKDWEMSATYLFAAQQIAIFYWITGNRSCHLAENVVVITAFYIRTNAHRGIHNFQDVKQVLTFLSNNVGLNGFQISNGLVVYILDLLVDALSLGGYLHLSFILERCSSSHSAKCYGL